MRERAPVEPQSVHFQPAASMSLPAKATEEARATRNGSKRRAALAFPATRFQLEELLDPLVDGIVRRERIVADLALLAQAPLQPLQLTLLLGRESCVHIS